MTTGRVRRVRPVILVHGGAGERAMTDAQRAALRQALERGHGLLDRGASALSAVEAAIGVLEGCGLFNAGVGARVQLDGVRRMDAAIMEGRRLRAGAVAGVEGVRHPIQAARLVAQRTPHVLLIGQFATRFARHFGLERQPRRPRTGDLPSRPVGTARTRHLLGALRTGTSRRRGRGGMGTVGAVALDGRGTVAAGASTGGIGLMLPGRVGDSPLIGAGVYADNESGAVSMTGIGECIVRIAAAKAITESLARGLAPAKAVRAVLRTLVSRTGGRAGSLVLARDGRLAIWHVTPRMAAGYWDGRGEPVVKDKFL